MISYLLANGKNDNRTGRADARRNASQALRTQNRENCNVWVLCELMNPDGTMAKGQQVVAFSLKSGIPMVSVPELVAYRKKQLNLGNAD